jgi:hypothetical protein
MNDFPLTPAEAVAVAAILDVSPKRLPHWHAWAVRLRTWGEARLTPSAAPEDAVAEPPTVDLVAALRASVEAAKARRLEQRS